MTRNAHHAPARKKKSQQPPPTHVHLQLEAVRERLASSQRAQAVLEEHERMLEEQKVALQNEVAMLTKKNKSLEISKDIMHELLRDMDTLEFELQMCRKHTTEHQEQQVEHARMSDELAQQIAEYEAALLENGESSSEDEDNGHITTASSLLATSDFLPQTSSKTKRYYEHDDDDAVLVALTPERHPQPASARFTLNRISTTKHFDYESEDSD